MLESMQINAEQFEGKKTTAQKHHIRTTVAKVAENNPPTIRAHVRLINIHRKSGSKCLVRRSSSGDVGLMFAVERIHSSRKELQLLCVQFFFMCVCVFAVVETCSATVSLSIECNCSKPGCSQRSAAVPAAVRNISHRCCLRWR